MSKVLIISHDVIGDEMAGPGVRYWEMARVLSTSHTVILVSPNEPYPEASGFTVKCYDARNILRLAKEVDAILVSGLVLAFNPGLSRLGIPIVADIYIPYLLEETYKLSRRELAAQQTVTEDLWRATRDQLRVGDFFICASERQRAYWLGWLNAFGRVNPLTFAQDPTLRSLIDVVPFGIPATPPQHKKQVLKGIHPHIRPTDKLILWGGGIYDWLDPLTLIRAVAEIARQRDDVKLFFMGVKHPNPDVDFSPFVAQSIELAKRLGVYDRSVFFNTWVAYGDRANYLMEADIGASLHKEHIETEFAFRTRIMDYIWAGLPIIATRGDELSELVQQAELGKVVDFENVHELVERLSELLAQPDPRDAYRDRFAKVASEFAWKHVIEPLDRFCVEPRLAADKGTSNVQSIMTRVMWQSPQPGCDTLFQKSYYYLQHKGIRAFLSEAYRYMKWWADQARRR